MLRRVEVINHPRGARADLHLGAHHRPHDTGGLHDRVEVAPYSAGDLQASGGRRRPRAGASQPAAATGIASAAVVHIHLLFTTPPQFERTNLALTLRAEEHADLAFPEDVAAVTSRNAEQGRYRAGE